jgi:hypothetical protein
MNTRTSFIWSIKRDELAQVCAMSTSFSQIVRHYGLVVTGTAVKYFKQRIMEDSIDVTHIRPNPGNQTLNRFKRNPMPLVDVMTEHSSYGRQNLKKRLLANGMLKNECSLCGGQPEWQSRPLVMILDHINGVNDDHRRENLRMVCPNCNSQLATFSGGNGRQRNRCVDCGKIISRRSERCTPCAAKCSPQPTKIDWPSTEELLVMVSERPFTTVAKELGVSDNAIRNRLKRH